MGQVKQPKNLFGWKSLEHSRDSLTTLPLPSRIQESMAMAPHPVLNGGEVPGLSLNLSLQKLKHSNPTCSERQWYTCCTTTTITTTSVLKVCTKEIYTTLFLFQNTAQELQVFGRQFNISQKQFSLLLSKNFTESLFSIFANSHTVFLSRLMCGISDTKQQYRQFWVRIRTGFSPCQHLLSSTSEQIMSNIKE